MHNALSHTCIIQEFGDLEMHLLLFMLVYAHVSVYACHVVQLLGTFTVTSNTNKTPSLSRPVAIVGPLIVDY